MSGPRAELNLQMHNYGVLFFRNTFRIILERNEGFNKSHHHANNGFPKMEKPVTSH